MKNFIVENELGLSGLDSNRNLAKPGRERQQRCEIMPFVLHLTSHVVNIFQHD